ICARKVEDKIDRSEPTHASGDTAKTPGRSAWRPSLSSSGSGPPLLTTLESVTIQTGLHVAATPLPHIGLYRAKAADDLERVDHRLRTLRRNPDIIGTGTDPAIQAEPAGTVDDKDHERLAQNAAICQFDRANILPATPELAAFIVQFMHPFRPWNRQAIQPAPPLLRQRSGQTFHQPVHPENLGIGQNLALGHAF